MMEKNNTWLGLPGGETLEAGVPVRVIFRKRLWDGPSGRCLKTRMSVS